LQFGTLRGSKHYDPPPVFHGTPGPNRLSSVANRAQAVTIARKLMISMTV
jgi:hypothetical protein